MVKAPVVVIRLLGLLGLLALPALAAAPAWAEQAHPQTRVEREAAAQVACAAGRPDEGSEILAALYAEFGHRNYVYNQARCYQQNGRVDQASNRFREYLRLAPDAPEEERTRIAGYLREMQAAEPASLPAEPAHEPAQGSLPSAPHLLAPAHAPTQHAQADSPHAGLRAAAITLGVAGLLGVAGGALATNQLRQVDKEVDAWATNAPGTVSTTDVAETEARGQRYRTLSAIGYGVGAAALLGGAACAFLGWRDQTPRQTDFAVIVSGNGVHASLRLGL
jgi:hypothetical protein